MLFFLCLFAFTCLVISFVAVVEREYSAGAIFAGLFVGFSSWLFASNHAPETETVDEYTVSVKNGVAFATPDLINLNEEMGRNFEDGDVVERVTTSWDRYLLVKYNDKVEWRIKE
jgi:hypothetical protein